LFICFLPIYSQIEQDTLTTRVISSFEGTHFKIAFMQNEIEMDYRKLLRIFMASKKRANVVVSYPNGSVVSYTIQPNAVQTVTVQNALEIRVPEIVSPLSIDIRSDVPIAVYALNSDYLTSDGFSSFPISFWDTSYIVISSPNDAYTSDTSASPTRNAFLTAIRASEFMVIASEDVTEVTITPKVNTKGGMIAGQPTTIFLNNGECYLVQSSSLAVGSGDLSGSSITSDKPIGVLSGHVRTSVPNFLGQADSKDHLVEMMPPLKTWGKEYASIPYIVMDQNGPALGGDVFRVVTSEPNTLLTVEFDNTTDVVFLPNAGSVYSRNTNRINFPTIWKADKPILVAQLMPSNQIKLSSSNSTDPFMIVLPPTEKFVSRILFQVPNNPPSNPNQYLQHFVTIIADSLAMELMRYDGLLVRTINPNFKTQKILKTSYYFTTLAVTSGQHEFATTKGKFGGSLYGGGFADSYGITLGFSLGESIRTDTIRPRFALTDSCGILYGSLYDLPSINASGIDDYYIVNDSSFNITTTFTPESDDTVQVLARVVDRLSDAKLLIDVYDRDGNGTKLRYYYIAPKITIPATVNFGNVAITDTTCSGFYVYNTGIIPITISKLTEVSGSKFYLKNQLILPITILPNDSFYIETCIFPNNGITKISDSIIVDFGCSIQKKIGVQANLQLINIYANGWDFGPVKVGDTVCAEAIIVNISNTAIVINELPCDSCDGFRLSMPLLPITLNPNDTLKVPICFIPDSVRNYKQLHSVDNDFNLDSKFRITGRGVKPVVIVNGIDWLKKRVGTNNDSTITFYNLGEAAAKVTYIREIEQFSGSFNVQPDYKQTFTVFGLDSFKIVASFVPQDTVVFTKNVTYSVDWQFHDTLQMELKGIGTLPIITTIDIDFGIIPVLTEKDSFATVVFAFGTESLTIDQFSLANTNPQNPFSFLDVNWQNSKIVQSGDSVRFTIRFSPKSLGSFVERVNVQHDANPNYSRSAAQFVLRGISAPVDTIEAVCVIISPNEFIACSNDAIVVEFENVGNAICILDSISISALNASIDFTNPIVPKTLQVGEKIMVNVTVTNISKNNPVTLRAIGYFKDQYDTLYFQRFSEVIVPVVTENIVLNPVPKLISIPGDSVTLFISGSFSKNIEYMPEDLIVSIYTDFQVFRLNKNELTIIFDNNGILTEISVPVVQTKEKITFTFPPFLRLFSGSIWKIQIPTLILLSDMEKEYPISVVFEGNGCSDLVQIESTFLYDEICIRGLRNIGVDTTRSVIAIVKPNPVGNTLTFDVQIAEKTDFSFHLTNTLGENILLNSKINLSKGLYSLNFDVTTVSNGAYIVHLISNKGEHFTYRILINK